MRTKARDGFIKALRDAHRWLDELLVDPTQTIESLAIREGKSERSIRMTLSLAFMSPALAEAAMVAKIDDTQAKDLKVGRWYFNLHSKKFPEGEIRGRVVGR